MYFESRINKILDCNDLKTIAEKFYTRSFSRECNGYKYNKFIFVDDRKFCSGSPLEVAVVNAEENKKVESITVSWLKDTKETYTYFLDAITRNENCGAVKVPMSREDFKNILVEFECGCCGNFFEDEFENQEKYDQDTGFGICLDCQQYY
jgi:hypothetical protein